MVVMVVAIYGGCNHHDGVAAVLVTVVITVVFVMVVGVVWL